MIWQRLIYAALSLALLVWPLTACGQGLGGSQSDLPVFGSGQMPTAVPGDDRRPTNVFQMSLMAAARFDDNALAGWGIRIRRSDIGYTFVPSLAFVQTLRRVEWGLSYGPGVDISQHHVFPDQFTHNFGGHFTWLISKRSSLSAQQNYIRSTNPFQRFGSQPFTTIPGPLDVPNQSIYLPNYRRTSLLSQAQYSYRLSGYTTFGLGGSFGLERYDNASSSTATDLLDSQNTSGRAYISHRFSPRNQLGLQYGAQFLKFRHLNARTTTHSFLIFEELKLTPNSRLSLFAGPQYSLLFNQAALNFGFITVVLPLRENTWTWSGGGSYSLTRSRTALALNYAHRVSNGGGFLGAVELDTGSADISWKATKNWTLNVDGTAANNQLLGMLSGQNELRSYSASLGLSRRIFRNIFMNLSFERLNQTGQIAGFAPGNHNIAGISFQYNFLKPIGR